MQCQTEFHIIKKGFIELINEKDFICYAKKNALIDQISIKKENNTFMLSFPMKNSSFNYKTTFNDINTLNNYIKNYI